MKSMASFKNALLSGTALTDLIGNDLRYHSRKSGSLDVQFHSLGLPQQLKFDKSDRGLVISSPVEVNANGGFFLKGPSPNLQDLRFSVLFWDRLALPRNNVIVLHAEDNAEIQFLKDAGVLFQPIANYAGGDAADVLVDAFTRTFRVLDEHHPGRWSVSRGENSVSFKTGEFIDGRGLLLQLHQAIPVPNVDVPLADILEFKQKRAAELLALRHHLEEVYLQVTSSPDKALAKALALEKIDKAVADVLKTGTESRLKFKLAGFEAKLDVLDLKAGMLAAAAGWTAGLPLAGTVLAGLIGAVTPNLSLKSSVGLKREKHTATPFEYVSRYHRDLF